MIAFALGALISYYVMQQAHRIDKLHQESQHRDKIYELESEITKLKYILQPEANEKDKKHWFDERMEQEAAATVQKIKEQESQGDALKNQFEKFIK